MISRVVLATHNAKKLAELSRVLAGQGLSIAVDGLDSLGAFPEPAETEDSFEGNALIKARAACLATGLPALADDSGLEVDGLGGRPGVRSARYAGESASDEENLFKVLRDLSVSGGPATARYVCVIALVERDGREHVFEGRCEGHLIPEPRGLGGFGYDPAFVPADTGPADGRTMAELSPDEKNAISHRGRAARELAAFLSRPRRA